MAEFDPRWDTLTLSYEWPIERLEGQRLDDDIESCLTAGWLYRTPIGNGWVRIGLTSAGRRQIAMVSEQYSTD